MLCEIQKIGDNHTKVHTVSGAECEASDEQHRIHDSERRRWPAPRFPGTRYMGALTKAFLRVTQKFVVADQ